MSFYRKYRPQTLGELVGQEHVCQTFFNALKKGELAHAYLFTGPRGTGKTSTARIIARALNCEQPAAGYEPCNQCAICTEALAGRLVDLIEIDAASNRGIDEIRDLKEKIMLAPSRAKYKVYIIDEVHMLTKEAFNALLKTLEEPPQHAYFILATTEVHKVPETIISRTQRFDFHRISVSEIVDHLKIVAVKENIEVEEKALTLIAKQSAGGLRDALGLLEQVGSGGEVTVEKIANILGLTRPQAVEDFTHAILFGQLADSLQTIDGLVADGVNLIQFDKAVIGRLREIMLERVAENKLSDARALLSLIEIFTRAGEELKNAVIPQLPLEMAVIEATTDKQPDDQTDRQPVADSGAVEIRSPSSPNPEIKKEKQLIKSEVKDQPESVQGSTLSPESVEKVLFQALSQIKTPATKMALRDSVVSKTDDETITLGVSSDFYLERLENSQTKAELATIFSKILKRDIVIVFGRAEVEIASTAPAGPATPSVGRPERKAGLAEKAEKLFSED